MLVATDKPQVEPYRREADGAWRFQRFGPGDVVPLTSIGVDLAVARLYAGVTLDRKASPAS